MQRSILCYGDSNTWGYVPLNPDSKNTDIQRYSRSDRWTGILQILLGEHFYVIEEGLNSRTTNLDYLIPPDRNGKTYLAPCLYTHAPIDLIVLALGGNDLKTCFNRSPNDIRDGLAELIDIIQSSKYGPNLQISPKILILPPPIPLPLIENYKDENGNPLFLDSINKSKSVAPLLLDLAKEKNCFFVDISKIISGSEIDGVHYDLVAHKKLAEIIYKKILEIFN